MKKQLRGNIKKLEEGKYKITVHCGWNEEKKIYERKTRIFYGGIRQAEAFQREWLNGLENPEDIVSSETVGDWLDYWLANDAKLLLSWEQNTERRAKGIVENNIKPNIGDILLAELKPDHILNMYKKLSEDGGRYDRKLSQRSIKYVHTILNQSLKHAVVRGRIKQNPAAGLTPSKSKDKPKDKWVVLDRKQLAEFLKLIEGHQDYCLIFVAAYTGARQSELLGLTWNRILWDEKGIRIDQALHKTYDGEGFEHRKRTKNATSTRTIDVSQWVLDVLISYREKQKERGISALSQPLLFSPIQPVALLIQIIWLAALGSLLRKAVMKE